MKLPALSGMQMCVTLLCCCLAITQLSMLAVAETVETPSSLTKALEGVSGARMMADVGLLSSPEFNGRQTGTADDLRSSLFITERFSSFALPASGPGFHPAAFRPTTVTHRVTTTHIGEEALLELHFDLHSVTLQIGTHSLPILDSPSVRVVAPVVFVGYGISDPARSFDEYEGIDVRNRVVLFLRGKPEGYPLRVSHAAKVRVAREQGAAAFLTMTGPVRSAYETRRGIPAGPLAYYGSTSADDGGPLPGAWISTGMGTTVLASRGHSLRAVQEELNRTLTPRSMETDVMARLSWDSEKSSGILHNVYGLLPGSDPTVQEETVLVGAHRDHFGRQAGVLFPGADDNASGTAVLLEVARAFALTGVKPKRSLLFASFSGEEQGLLGSELYISRPQRPLNKTVAMVNVDHVGVGNKRLTVGIAGLPKAVAVEAGQVAGLADKLDLYGFFPGGDHVPFKKAGVPTITIVSAGSHPHFHQPSDRADTIQPEILEAVARYVLTLTWHLANRS
ncbi:MAG: M28 family peptidase [Nitrospira sp.]|nr:M28 family peptidase [Nitrospira sp.]